MNTKVMRYIRYWQISSASIAHNITHLFNTTYLEYTSVFMPLDPKSKTLTLAGSTHLLSLAAVFIYGPRTESQAVSSLCGSESL